jgi:hypothetical protein
LPDQYDIAYKGSHYRLDPKRSIKICGIVFSTDEHTSYSENVLNKIQKLQEQLNKWRARGLSFLGKSLITKTFGISQLIYVAQCCIIKDPEIKQINDIILNFLWTKGGSARRVERIKREIIYKPPRLGGFGVIEFGCLDKAIKFKQVLRANKSRHPIRNLQDVPRIEPFLISYNTNEDIASEVKIRATELAYELIKNEHAGLQWFPGLNIGKIYDYFNVHGLSAHYARQLKDENVYLIGECINLKTCPRLGNKARLACKWIEKNLLQIIEDLEGVILDWNVSKENFGIYKDDVMIDLTVSVASRVMRNSMMALIFSIDAPINIRSKYPLIGIEEGNEKEPIAMQKIARIRSIRLRNNMLRIINGDVFSKERMHRFGMIEEDKCDRCGEVETRDHLLFTCEFAKKLWQLFAAIYRKVFGRNFDKTERNILACGDNYNSLATTTIIAELTKNNVLNRPRYENEEVINIY